MALWIHNISDPTLSDDMPNRYAVKINRETLVEFNHIRSAGAADCFRAAAVALDAAGHKMKHDK